MDFARAHPQHIVRSLAANIMKTELIKFIEKQTHLNANQITPELKVAEDIGFYGLDALIFFEEFFDEFNIRNLDEFDLELYIDGSVDFARKPFSWMKNLFIKSRRKYLNPDVTIGHLDKVVKKGEWFDER